MSDSISLPSRTDFENSPLAELARRVGIELEYLNAAGESVAIDPGVVRAILAAMNLSLTKDMDAQDQLAALEAKEEGRSLPPVMVVRDDQHPLRVPVRFDSGDTPLAWRLALEDGAIIEGSTDKNRLEAAASTSNPDLRLLTIEQHLPPGYHQLEIDQLNARMLLIVAPRRCWIPPALEQGAKMWGLATQLYLLQSDSNWGIGDFSDLRKLLDLAAGWGAALVGLNPLHAMFLDNPTHASPYSPVSRLFLNVLNVDVTAIPEFATSSAMRTTLESDQFKAALEKARAASLLDYESVAKLKLDALRSLFRTFQHEAASERRRRLRSIRAERWPRS